MKKINIVLVLLLGLFTATNALAEEIIIEPNAYLPVRSTAEGPIIKFFIKYNFPDSLKNKTILFAYLEMETELDTAIHDKAIINVLPLTEEWSGSSLPEVKSSLSVNDTLLTYLHQSPGNNEGLRFNVTEIVSKWLKGELDNNGFVVMQRKNANRSFMVLQEGEKILADLRILCISTPDVNNK